MRVICIKQGEWKRALGTEMFPAPIYMEECEVIGMEEGNGNLEPGYELGGYPPEVVYAIKYFRPIPDISELQSLLTSIPKTVTKELEPVDMGPWTGGTHWP